MLALRDCFYDHACYIKSYINETKMDIKRDIKAKAKYKKDLRVLLRDITLMYPQLTASLLTNDNIIWRGGGGELEKTKAFVESTRNIFAKFKQLDINAVATKAAEIQESLKQLEAKFDANIKKIEADQQELNTSTILTGLLETQANLNAFIDGTYRPTVASNFRRAPNDVVPFDVNQAVNVYNLFIKNTLEMLRFDDTIQTIIIALLNAATTDDLKANLKRLPPNTEFVPSILAMTIDKEIDEIKTYWIKKLCEAYVPNVKINMTRIEQLRQTYSSNMAIMVERDAQLDQITTALQKGNDTATQFIDHPEDVNFTLILAHTIPSIKHMGLMLRNCMLYELALPKELYKEMYDLYEATPLGELMKAGDIPLPDETINLFLENFYEKDMQRMRSFLKNLDRQINSLPDPQIFCNEITNAMITTYRKIYYDMQLTPSEREVVNYAIKIETGLIVQDTPQSELHMTAISTENDNMAWMNAYNEMFAKKKNAIYLAKKGLPSCIRMFPQHIFMEMYTETIYNDIFTSSSENIVEKHEILEMEIGALGDTLYNPNFRNLQQQQLEQQQQPQQQQQQQQPQLELQQQQQQPQLELQQQQQQQQQLEQQPEQHLVRVGEQETREISNLLLELCAVSIRCTTKLRTINKLGSEYNELYAHIYNYVKFLILIATNQMFSSRYVVYTYFNKGLIVYYKRNLDKIMSGMINNQPDANLLFIKNNYFMIMKHLTYFFTQLSTTITDRTGIIDIRGINNPVLKKYFVLLNGIKNVIDSFVETSQYRLAIYARINDRDISGSKIFISDNEINGEEKGNPSLMYVDASKCTRFYAANQKYTRIPITVTEVFDTLNFPNNSDIAKYMTLPAQLSKRKSVCMITYGYSGTGKTYTLFGAEGGRQGILQSTLANINGLRNVKIRLFEIYGRGFASFVYWNEIQGNKRQDSIYQKIFEYKLNHNGTTISFDKNQMKEHESKNNGFNKFIVDENDNTYLDIDEMSVSNVFANFSTLIKDVDAYRRDNKRIIETANNPVSSRSILVYEFRLYINEKSEDNAVTFLVLDLPGRENIIDTFVEPYVAKVKDKISDEQSEKLRMILTCMALNPMALSVFATPIIKKTLQTKNMLGVLWEKIRLYNVNSKWKLNEMFKGVETNTLELMTKFEAQKLKTDILVTTDVQVKEKTGVAQQAKPSTQQQISDKLLKERENKQPVGLMGYSTSMDVYKEQMWQIIITFMLYQIMMDNNFELLVEIYSNILKTAFPNLVLTPYEEFIQPFEGIYINENIIGLMKYLSDVLMGHDKETIPLIQKQVKVSLVEMRNIIRAWITTNHTIWNDEAKRDKLFAGLGLSRQLYNANYIAEPHIAPNNRYFSMQNETPTKLEINIQYMRQCQKDMVLSYIPSKIYNYEDPLIKEILAPFIVPNEAAKTKYIKDFKLFYLFGNYAHDETQKKCKDQIELILDSKETIEAFVR